MYLKYVETYLKYLNMYEISSEIVRYGLQCSEKLGTSKSDGNSWTNKVVPMGLPGVENDQGLDDNMFTLQYLEPTSSHIREKMRNSLIWIERQLLF